MTSDFHPDLDQAVLDAARGWVNAGYPTDAVARAMRKWAGALVQVWKDDMRCQVCGRPPLLRHDWQDIRLGQRFCSNACRQRAYRQRRAAAE